MEFPIHPPNLNSIWSVVCMQMSSNWLTNQRPGNCRNSAGCDQKSIGSEEDSNECIHQIWDHYGDVIMDAIASQIPIPRLFTLKPFIQTQIKENIKAPRHWPLCGEFTGDWWIPCTNGQWPENVSIWWRHHAIPCRSSLSGNAQIPQKCDRQIGWMD